MKTLNEYIESLQKIVEEQPERGEHVVIYAKDDEGNEYHPVHFSPSVLYAESPLTNYVEVVSEEDVDEEESDNYVQVICIN